MARKKTVEIVLDIETTGLDFKRERIIEFAAIRLENGKEVDKYETLINPQQHIRKSSIQIHGITEELVANAPFEENVIDDILNFIGDYTIVGHNVIFDFSFLNEASLRHKGKALINHRVDSQFLYKEVFPDEEYPNLDNLAARFGLSTNNRHRAMGDTQILAKVYPKLKKLYEKKYDWQLKQLDNIEYLFERYLRVQQMITTCQAELQDLKSIFKLYFENNGEPVVATTGEILTYNCKQNFGYDFSLVKDALENIGALSKAVKLNNGFVDRLAYSDSIDDDIKEQLIDARMDISETRHIQIIKPDRKCVKNDA